MLLLVSMLGGRSRMMLLHYQRVDPVTGSESIMPRGGKREGAGGKPGWKNGRTKPVRVPVVLADKILEIAKILDEEGLGESVTGSKVLDLTGIAIYASKDGPVVRLADLVKAGYDIQPERLTRNLRTQVSKTPLISEIDNFLGAQNE